MNWKKEEISCLSIEKEWKIDREFEDLQFFAMEKKEEHFVRTRKLSTYLNDIKII